MPYLTVISVVPASGASNSPLMLLGIDSKTNCVTPFSYILEMYVIRIPVCFIDYSYCLCRSCSTAQTQVKFEIYTISWLVSDRWPSSHVQTFHGLLMPLWDDKSDDHDGKIEVYLKNKMPYWIPVIFCAVVHYLEVGVQLAKFQFCSLFFSVLHCSVSYATEIHYCTGTGTVLFYYYEVFRRNAS